MIPVKRHVVSIHRPAAELDDRGQVDGPHVVAESIPCSIEPLSGRELEIARTVMAAATQRVRFYDDPSWQLTTKDWLLFGQRRLNIGHIKRRDEVQLEVELLCAEAA